MANFSDNTNIVKVKFNSSSGFSLTYTDLMAHLAFTENADSYPVYKVFSKDVETTTGESDEIKYQALVNTAISERTSFNATVYAFVQRRDPITNVMQSYSIDNTNYSHVKVNNYYFERPVDPNSGAGETQYVTDIPESRVISEMKSLYFNGVKNLTFDIDSLFSNANDVSNDNSDEETKSSFRSIKDGEYFYVYITVDTIDTRNIPFTSQTDFTPVKFAPKTATLFYQFIYAEPHSEHNDDEPELPGGDIPGQGGSGPGYNPETDDEIPWSEIGPFQLSEWKAGNYIFINTVPINQLEESDFPLKIYNGIFRIHISPMCPVPFTWTLRIHGKNTVTDKVFKYTPKTVDVTGATLPRLTKMNNPDVSYALLRTNPKLTGNIKVVVDENSNLYLDTFKVNDALTQKKYRHIKVGGNSYYGSGIMKFFKDLPTTDLYMIERKCTNIFTPAQTYDNQYYDTYRYGVKTNDDNLYSENFALLAPLCVKRVLPDFFLVFRVDKDSKEYNENLSDEKKLEYFLRYGKLIKSYDMRQDSVLGNYIRNVYDSHKEYQGDIFVSYDTDNFNKFIGISLDRGVVTPMLESVYLEKDINNQVALNDFYTSGFERNHIVSKDIINFEFMFNDLTDTSQFSINTYFGLYVKVNEEDQSFSCISSEVVKDEITKLETVKNVFDSSVHTYEPNTDLRYSNKGTLIYGVTTPTEFIRLDTGLFDSNKITKFSLLPYKNVLSSKIVKHEIENTAKSFITLELQKPLEVGEHIRVIDKENSVIYEVITSDIDKEHITEGTYIDNNGLSDVVVNYFNEQLANFVVYRQNMFITNRDYSLTNDKVDEVLSNQCEQLYFAFKKFKGVKSGNSGSLISSYSLDKNSHKVSLISSSEQAIFERICAPGGFVSVLDKYLNETADENEAIKFFGSIYPEKTILNVSDLSVSSTLPRWKASHMSYLYPFNFDITGNRMAFIVDFLNIGSIADDNRFYTVDVEDETIFDAKTLIYYSYKEGDSNNETPVKYDNIKLTTYRILNGSFDLKEEYVGLIESYKDFSKHLINVKSPVLQAGNRFLLYNSYPLNAGICSILNFKDFATEVLDNTTAILSSEPPLPVGRGGEFCEKSFFNQRPIEKYDEIAKSLFAQETISAPEINDDHVSMYNVGDSILSIEDSPKKYVIKHMTLEEFKADIITRIQHIINPDDTVTKKKVYMPEGVNATNSPAGVNGDGTENDYYKLDESGKIYYEIDNVISAKQKSEIETILGINENYLDYAGYILRPYMPGTNIYNKGYKLFNHIVKFDYSNYTGIPKLASEIDNAGEFVRIVNESGQDMGEPDDIKFESSDSSNEFMFIGEGGSYKIPQLPELDYVNYEDNSDNEFYFFPFNNIDYTAEYDESIIGAYYTVYYVSRVEGEVGQELQLKVLPPFTKPGFLHAGVSITNRLVVGVTSHNVNELFGESINGFSVDNKPAKIGLTDEFLTNWLNSQTGEAIIQRNISVFSNNWKTSVFVPNEIDNTSEIEDAPSSQAIDESAYLEYLQYSDTPIFTKSEENIKDYIDKLRLYDVTAANSFGIDNQNHIQNRSKYLETLFNSHHTILDSPLVSPKACKWRSIGTDARAEDMRVMYSFNEINDASSFYVVSDKEYNDYLGVMQFENKNKTSTANDTPNYKFPKYIGKSFIDVCLLDSKDKNGNFLEKTSQTLKNYILYGNGNLDDILYDSLNSSSRFSTAYLSGDNTLEFISGGIKFKFHSTNDNIMDLTKYSGYSAVFINMPIANITSDKQVELIIDEMTNELMFIWYSYTNTLRYGFKVDPLKQEDFVFSTLADTVYPFKLNYKKGLDEVVCSQIMDQTTGKIFNAMSFEDSGHIGSGSSSAGSEYIDINNNNSHVGEAIADFGAHIWLSNIDVNADKFTSHNNICLTGFLFNTTPISSESFSTYPYYAKENNITVVDPFIWHNDRKQNSMYQFHDTLTNSLVDNLIFDTPKYKEAILYSDTLKISLSSKRTLSDLLDSLSNYAVFVKTQNGTKDFTTLNDILEISIVSPITYNRNYSFNKQYESSKTISEYLVHSTYASPVMNDIFVFNYNSADIKNNCHSVSENNLLEDSFVDNKLSSGLIVIDPNEGEIDLQSSTSEADSLEDVFEKSFDGANVSIKSVNKIPQIWINKYSDNASYCVQTSISPEEESKFYTSFDVVNNVSVFNDSWENTKYRRYEKVKTNNSETETYYSIPGYKVGNELKTFFNSKAIVLKDVNTDRSSVIITNWKNTHISSSTNTIKLDISDSLVYAILERESFISSWKALNLPTNDEKINYIKNNILDHIIINNKTKFVLAKDKSKLKSLRFNGVYPNQNDNNLVEEVKNFKNSLVYENGKYYMNVYPEDKHMFYAKLIIDI